MGPGIWTIIIIACLAIATIFGTKLKINVGTFGFVFAFILYVFVLGGKVGDLWGFFPADIVLKLLFLCYFFAYATTCGAIDTIANAILYLFRKIPGALPLVGGVLAALLVLIGVNASVPTIVLLPIFIAAAEKIGMSTKAVGMVLPTLAVTTLFTPSSMLGGVLKGLLPILLPEGVDTTAVLSHVSLGSIIIMTIMGIVWYIVLKGWKYKLPEGQTVDQIFQKPKAPDKKQWMVLIMIIITFILVIIPSIIPAVKVVTDKIDINFLFLFFGLICALFRVAPERDIFKQLPWGMVILLGGMTTLFAIAGQVGIPEFLGTGVAQVMPKGIVIIAVAFVAGFLGFFSDGLGVVIPLMTPVAVTVAVQLDINVTSMCAACVLGAMLSASSPLSSGGAIALSMLPERDRSKVFIYEWIAALAATLAAGIIGQLGIV